MAQKDIDAMERQLRNWLSEEGRYKDKVKDDDAHFHLIIEVPQGSGRQVHVVQPKTRDDLVVVGSMLNLPEEVLTALKALPKKKREGFWWDIKFAILFQRTSFKMEPSQNPTSIEFTTTIHYDGMSKDALEKALDTDFRCTLLIIWKFQERFGSDLLGAPPQPPGYQ